VESGEWTRQGLPFSLLSTLYFFGFLIRTARPGSGVRAAQATSDVEGGQKFRISEPVNSHENRAAAPSPEGGRHSARCRGRRSILGSGHASGQAMSVRLRVSICVRPLWPRHPPA